VADRTRSSSAQQTYRRRFFQAENRSIIIAACLISAAAIVIGGHLYGRFLANRELGGRDTAIEQLRTESQRQKRQNDQQSAQLTEMATKLKGVQAKLDAIMPAANTYDIIPNQTLLVADGHLAVGLIGAPGNEGITLNINGKQQTVAAGQVVSVAVDQSTSCLVSVQSFDMFKAVLTATCPDAGRR
jgi:H+/gluconate symporter-like permease